MAIQAGGVAIVSLGVSCQVTHQISRHSDLIGDLIGAPVKSKGTPFDWMVSPAQSTARMIGEWRSYPEDPAGLAADHKPYWPQIPSWFWHDDQHLEAGTFLSRRGHLVENLSRLRQTERQVFVLANTQRNLHVFARRVVHPLNFVFEDEDLDALEAALEAQFPNPELWVVVRKDRHRLQGRKGHPRVIEYVPDVSKWRGDDEQWAAAFKRMLGSAETSEPGR